MAGWRVFWADPVPGSISHTLPPAISQPSRTQETRFPTKKAVARGGAATLELEVPDGLDPGDKIIGADACGHTQAAEFGVEFGQNPLRLRVRTVRCGWRGRAGRTHDPAQVDDEELENPNRDECNDK